MLQSRWQPAVSNNLIHVNSTLKGCYAVAAASSPVSTSVYSAEVVYSTPALRQGGFHTGVALATSISVFDSLWMDKRGEGKPRAASRSQAQKARGKGGG